MSGKHCNWHAAWTRLPDGRLRHTSAATFIVRAAAGGLRLDTDANCLEAFQASELARGVPAHDLGSRLQRLAREALAWEQDRRNAAPAPIGPTPPP